MISLFYSFPCIGTAFHQHVWPQKICQMDFFGWHLILLYAPSIKYCGTNAFSVKGCLFFKGYFRPLEYLAKNCILFTQDDVINMHHSGESQCYLKECKKPCKIQENCTLQSQLSWAWPTKWNLISLYLLVIQSSAKLWFWFFFPILIIHLIKQYTNTFLVKVCLFHSKILCGLF